MKRRVGFSNWRAALNVDLFEVERDLRGEVHKLRLAWPHADATNPEISVEVRAHTKTINQRADNFEVAAETIKIIGQDPVRWRLLMSLPKQKFMDLVDQMSSA